MPENKVEQIKVKACEVMQYYSYMDVAELGVVVSRIMGLTNLKSWCIIDHDKDLLPSGKPKGRHFHAVLTFSNSTTIGAIAKAIKVEPQFVNKIKTTVKSAQLYLVHRNDPEKFQYDPQDVKASFDYEELADGCPAKQKRENIAEKIAKGEIKEYNLARYVTVDEFAKNRQYYARCFEYRQQSMKGLNRNMECYFITGASGTGKTTYAKMLASQNGYECYISSGGKNPLDNYKGEECIILDDTRSSSWSLSDFLKLTDNHTDSLVGCRYYNKSIAECKLLIVTSVKSIDEFYENALKEDSNEPRIQLYRRFKLVLKMTATELITYSYVESHKRHIELFTVKNPVAMLFNPDVAKQTAQDVAKLLGVKLPEDSVPKFLEVDPELPLPFDEED